jgi:hypothetical protein
MSRIFHGNITIDFKEFNFQFRLWIYIYKERNIVYMAKRGTQGFVKDNMRKRYKIREVLREASRNI